MTKLSPSILSADFSRLGQDCRQVLEAGADRIVAGSSVFGVHTAENIRAFQEIFNNYYIYRKY